MDIFPWPIPDRRGCLDFFRPQTTTAAWVEAYLQQRDPPSEAQIFKIAIMSSGYRRGEGISRGFDPILEIPDQLIPPTHPKAAYATSTDRLEKINTENHDAHCWVLTPSSFEFFIRECHHIGVIDLEFKEIYSAV